MKKILLVILLLLFVATSVFAKTYYGIVNKVMKTDANGVVGWREDADSSPAWGSITGTLSGQTDLQGALDGKAPSLGADDNYVTGAEKVIIGNTSGANTGDNTVATTGDAAVDFFGAGVTAVTDGTTTTDIEGRSLTIGTGVLNVDAETYIYKAKIAFENPVAGDDFFFDELTHAVTFTKIYAKTLVGTVDFDITVAGADINGTDITADTTGVLDETLGGDITGAVGEEIKLEITSVASAPTYIMVILTGTYDD